MDVLRDHRRNDLRHDRDDHRVRCNVSHRDRRVMYEKTGQNDLRNHETKCHRVDLTIDSACYVGHRLPLDDRHRMGCFGGVFLLMFVNLSIHNHDHRVDLSIDPPCYGVDDLKLGVNLDVSRGRRMNDRLGDHSMGVDHRDALVGHHMNAMDDRNDLKMDGNSDVRLCHRMYDLLGDRSLGASRVNRRTGVHLNAQLVYEHRVDLTIDPECYAMSHRVMYY